MKATFNKHHQDFDDDEIMRVLNELNDNMNEVFDGAKGGMETIERAVAWLESK